MTSTIELESSLQTDHGADVILSHGLGQLLLGDIEVVDVGLVVLAVVDLHNLGGDHLEVDLDRKVSPHYIYEKLTGSKAL